jgi:hypothetical protein
MHISDAIERLKKTLPDMEKSILLEAKNNDEKTNY